MHSTIRQTVFNMLAVSLIFASIQRLQSAEEYPNPPSKKGLQVQMVDDALELGIHHAAINLNLGQCIDPASSDPNWSWKFNDAEYHFHANYINDIDAIIKPLSDAGVVVSLIVLNYEPRDEALRRILLHPDYSTAAPNRLSAFNVRSDEGRRWLEATLEFLSHRWSRPDQANGRVWNWIIGNEVNSHWFWYNMGEAELEELTQDYSLALNIACRAIMGQQPQGRVFVSLDHHWNIAYPGGNAMQTVAGRPLLEQIVEKTMPATQPELASDHQGKWHVAYHPYPENLFEPRSWLDKSATDDWRLSPRITFKNLEQLSLFLQSPAMLLDGRTRRIILSEQGFHTPDSDDGETIQASSFCYAWRIVNAVEEIDAFILHRHVDHAHEGGLRLGLWTRFSDSISRPERKKRLWSVFKAAGTDREEAAFQFALPPLQEPD